MNVLYHVGTANLNNKYQFNDAIYYDPKIDNTFSLCSVVCMYPLPVVTVNLRGDKKNRAKIISGLACLWDIRSTGGIINFKYANPYERIINYNNIR